MRHHKINNDIDPQWQSMMNRHRSEFCSSASWSSGLHMTPWRHISAIVPVCVYMSLGQYFCAKFSHDFDSGSICRWVCLFWLLLSRTSILQNNVLSCVNNVEVVGIRLWQRLYSVTLEGPVALLERHHIWRLATICRHHHSSDVLSIDFVLQARNVSSYYTRYDVRRYVQSEASGHVTIPTFCWL